MDVENVEGLGSRHRIVVDLKNRTPAKYAAHLSGTSRAATSYLPALKPSSIKPGKRKRQDVCMNRCSSSNFASGRSLVRRYANFMKSGLPDRLMIYQNDEWADLSSEIVGLVRKEFDRKKAAAEVILDGHHLVLDFLHMVQVDMKADLECPLAWIDQSGRPFFPETYAAADGEHVSSGANGTQELKLQIDIDLNGIGATDDMENCGESDPLVKRNKVVGRPAINDLVPEVADSCDRASDAKNKIYPGVPKIRQLGNFYKKIISDYEEWEVHEAFLLGMEDMPGFRDIHFETRPCSAPMLQDQKELFMKQFEITAKCRGSANACHAWLAADKETISSLETYGLLNFGLPKIRPAYGLGVHLAAAFSAHIRGTIWIFWISGGKGEADNPGEGVPEHFLWRRLTLQPLFLACSDDRGAKYCDVDENGVRHMVLCRVILGNLEPIQPGSRQLYPISEKFDSGVDNLQDPGQYVVWLMNAKTHIFPEYIVSFKLPANVEENLVENAHNVEVAGDRKLNLEARGYYMNSEGSKDRPTILNSSTGKTPKSPWMPFPLLFASIAEKVPPYIMGIIYESYEHFRNKRMSRVHFVSKLRALVGDNLLRSTITKLQSTVPVENEIAA